MATVWVCGISGSGVRSVVAALTRATATADNGADTTAQAIDAIEVRPEQLPEVLPSVCMIVISAEQGFPPAVAEAWTRCAEEFVPRICVWTHIDTGRADDDELRAMAERVFEEQVFPLALPIAGDDEEFVAVLDLPHQQIHLDAQGGRVADAEHISLSAPMRDELVDAAAATIDDPNILDQLSLGLTLDGQRSWTAVMDAVRSGQLAVAVPIRPVAPAIGITLLNTLVSNLVTSAN